MDARGTPETRQACSLAEYWRESSRPLASLAFVAPMLVIYEASMILLGPQAARNGADVWLRGLLNTAGFGQYFLLPAFTCAILMGWHHTSRRAWRLHWGVVSGMFFESMAFGFLLLVLARLQASLFAVLPAALACSTGEGGASVGRVAGYLGAGIYEELLFRLMLLPAAVVSLRWAGASRAMSIVGAVLGTSVIFSAAHYGVFSLSGYDFDWFSFVFRCMAGISFALLFLFRGFGIAAGAHAFYDVYVILLR